MDPAPPSAAAQPAPAAPRVYRGAMADRRGMILLLALCGWLVGHIVLGTLAYYRVQAALLSPTAFVPEAEPTGAVWFSARDLQVGVAALGNLGATFLDSVAWQIGGLFLLLAAVVVIATARLRIVALVIPTALLLLAMLAQCVSYSIYHPYWAQGSTLLTLLFLLVVQGSAWALAPRNSGWRELGMLARDLGRQMLRNPGGVLFGPIFDKEVRVTGRRRGTYWIRALYPLGLVALISFVYYIVTADVHLLSSGAERMMRLQEVAPILAVSIGWAQYVILLFLGAVLTCSAVCDERRTRTLASLMTTPMTAPQIILGKLTGALMQLLIIGLISVPFLLAVRIFGGLEPEFVVAILSITVSSTILMAALGIMCSVWSRRPAAAAGLTLLLYILINFVPILIIIVMAINGGGRGGPPVELGAFSSPISMIFVTAQISGGAGLPIMLRELWTTNSVINLSLAGAAVFIASVSLRGVMLSDTALDAPAAKKRRTRRVRVGTPIPAVAAEGAGEATPPVADEGAPPPVVQEVSVERDTLVGDQPVLWRELRQPVIGSRRVLILATVVIGALLLWLYSEVSPAREEPHAIVVVIGMLLLTLQSAIVSTPSVTNEKDAATWPTLLSTPLTASEILLPKLLGGLKKLWFVAAVMGIELLIGALAGAVHPILFVHLFMIIASVGVFLGGTGVLFSLGARRGVTAAILNMLVAGGLWVGLPLLMLVLFQLLLGRFGRGGGFSMQDAVLVINPIFMAVEATQGSVSNRGVWQCRLPGGSSLSMADFTMLLAVVSGLGCALGLGAVALACSRFKQYSGRTS